MNRDTALSILRSLRSRLEARGIAHAALFGSVARGEAGACSDVDVFVTPQSGRRLDLIDLGGVQTLLDESFSGFSVDVVVAPVKHAALQRHIAQERIDAF
jgi:predicted nucleotidyltransferase